MMVPDSLFVFIMKTFAVLSVGSVVAVMVAGAVRLIEEMFHER